MQESSESSLNEVLQEVTELMSALNNMEKVAEEKEEAAKASRERLGGAC
jgi:hypothetical protein